MAWSVFFGSKESSWKILYLYLHNLYFYLRVAWSVFFGSEAPSWAQRSKDKWDRSTFLTMRSGYTHVTHLLKRSKRKYTKEEKENTRKKEKRKMQNRRKIKYTKNYRNMRWFHRIMLFIKGTFLHFFYTLFFTKFVFAQMMGYWVNNPCGGINALIIIYNFISSRCHKSHLFWIFWECYIILWNLDVCAIPFQKGSVLPISMGLVYFVSRHHFCRSRSI